MADPRKVQGGPWMALGGWGKSGENLGRSLEDGSF